MVLPDVSAGEDAYSQGGLPTVLWVRVNQPASSEATMMGGATRLHIGTVDGMDRWVLVTDPEFGTIAAVIDAEGSVTSTAADVRFDRTNLTPYVEAADLAARELAALYAEANPEHAQWIAERFWDDCIAEGGSR